MNKPKRLATGNKVKIINKASQHFGKTGILIEASFKEGCRFTGKFTENILHY